MTIILKMKKKLVVSNKAYKFRTNDWFDQNTDACTELMLICRPVSGSGIRPALLFHSVFLATATLAVSCWRHAIRQQALICGPASWIKHGVGGSESAWGGYLKCRFLRLPHANCISGKISAKTEPRISCVIRKLQFCLHWLRQNFLDAPQ